MKISSDPNSSHSKSTTEDQKRENFLDGSSNSIYHPKELFQVNEVSSDKPVYDYSQYQPNRRNYFEEIFENTVRELPERREAKELTDDLLNSNNLPWIRDYPKSGQNDYTIDSNYLENTEDGDGLIYPRDYVDPRENSKHPQYFQKNYYYNYYPVINEKTATSNEKYELGELKKNFDSRIGRRRNPCRYYLEFLKYAFDKLDEDPQFNYNEIEDQGPFVVKEPGTPTIFMGPRLQSPTFFDDNWKIVTQLYQNRNNVQVTEGVTPDTNTKISIFTDNINRLPATTNVPPVEHTTSYFKQHHKFWSTEPTTTTTEEKYFENESTTLEEDDYNDAETTPTTVYERTKFPLTTKHYTEVIPKYNTTERNEIHVDTVVRFNSTYNNIYNNNNNNNNNNNSTEECNDKVLPCPDIFNITYPLNGYCNRYVSCESGRAIRRTCPEGLHFNVVIKSCDLPHNSICTYTCPNANGFFGIPGDCGGYFACKNSNPEYRMCPPKMHWDINRNTCIFSEFSSCPMKCMNNSDVTPYDGDCRGYVICLNGIPYYHRCPPNTNFSWKNLTCVPSMMSSCQDDPRLATKMMNPSTFCKNVQNRMNTNAWCNSFMNPNK